MAIITISGDLGSGKSSLTKILIEKLGYRRVSAGEAFRKIAADRGITLQELSKIAENDPSIDEQMDTVIAEIGQREDNLIVDSRLAWHFIPNSFKIKLVVTSLEAARRVINDGTRHLEKYKDVDDAAFGLKERRKSEVSRFKEYYGIDIKDDNNFDIVVDTNSKTIEEVGDIVLEALKKAGIYK